MASVVTNSKKGGPKARAARWSIERLSPEHSAQAGALVKLILRDEFSQALTLCADADLDDMHRTYRQAGREAWVALAESRVVGVIAVKEAPEGSIKIKRFYVHRDWRGHGVGRALHDGANAWIEREGYQHIVLTTTEAMVRAREFYREQGYEESGTAETQAARLHLFRRVLKPRPLGARLPTDGPPAHGDDEVGLIIERPRGFIEGWHWDEAARQLVLSEFYDRPVPVNYGFAPEWSNDADGEALDVIVLDDRRMRPGEALIGVAAGVVWRPDGDHKLLVEPSGGAVRPIALDAAYRERVASWWGQAEQPTGWDGPDGVPRFLSQCRRRG